MSLFQQLFGWGVAEAAADERGDENGDVQDYGATQVELPRTTTTATSSSTADAPAPGFSLTLSTVQAARLGLKPVADRVLASQAPTPPPKTPPKPRRHSAPEPPARDDAPRGLSVEPERQAVHFVPRRSAILAQRELLKATERVCKELDEDIADSGISSNVSDSDSGSDSDDDYDSSPLPAANALAANDDRARILHFERLHAAPTNQEGTTLHVLAFTTNTKEACIIFHNGQLVIKAARDTTFSSAECPCPPIAVRNSPYATDVMSQQHDNDDSDEEFVEYSADVHDVDETGFEDDDNVSDRSGSYDSDSYNSYESDDDWTSPLAYHSDGYSSYDDLSDDSGDDQDEMQYQDAGVRPAYAQGAQQSTPTGAWRDMPERRPFYQNVADDDDDHYDPAQADQDQHYAAGLFNAPIGTDVFAMSAESRLNAFVGQMLGDFALIRPMLHPW